MESNDSIDVIEILFFAGPMIISWLHPGPSNLLSSRLPPRRKEGRKARKARKEGKEGRKGRKGRKERKEGRENERNREAVE